MVEARLEQIRGRGAFPHRGYRGAAPELQPQAEPTIRPENSCGPTRLAEPAAGSMYLLVDLFLQHGPARGRGLVDSAIDHVAVLVTLLGERRRPRAHEGQHPREGMAGLEILVKLNVVVSQQAGLKVRLGRAERPAALLQRQLGLPALVGVRRDRSGATEDLGDLRPHVDHDLKSLRVQSHKPEQTWAQQCRQQHGVRGEEANRLILLLILLLALRVLPRSQGRVRLTDVPQGFHPPVGAELVTRLPGELQLPRRGRQVRGRREAPLCGRDALDLEVLGEHDVRQERALVLEDIVDGELTAVELGEGAVPHDVPGPETAALEGPLQADEFDGHLPLHLLVAAARLPGARAQTAARPSRGERRSGLLRGLPRQPLDLDIQIQAASVLRADHGCPVGGNPKGPRWRDVGVGRKSREAGLRT
mmetsp:Transcript_25054/g.70441  ORF Transcript_25054/g.70441 Transcript_25054/m.70441 type:complete len:419 (+) Transcript_25054:381-1637(+)